MMKSEYSAEASVKKAVSEAMEKRFPVRKPNQSKVNSDLKKALDKLGKRAVR